MKIYLESGDIDGTYIISNDETNETKFIQTDFEFPTVAQYFGWNGDNKDIEGAREFLDEIADTEIGVEDVGYFDGDQEFSDESLETASDPYGFEMDDDIGLLQDEDYDEPDDFPSSDLSRYDDLDIEKDDSEE